MNSTPKTETLPQSPATQATYYEGIGRRKDATARLRLYVAKDTAITVKDQTIEKGSIIINGMSIEKYFPGDVSKKIYMEPFRTTNTVSRFAVSVVIEGGGLQGQLGAFIHASSRALEKVDREKFRPILKKRGFMTRDPRTKQRRKAGFAGKSRARKQSPKR